MISAPDQKTPSRHYKSGRYSTRMLSPHTQDGAGRKFRSPNPTTPAVPSSAQTQDLTLASLSSPTSSPSDLGDHTHLTIPEFDGEDDDVALIKPARVQDPFTAMEEDVKIEESIEEDDDDDDEPPFRHLALPSRQGAGSLVTGLDETDSNWDLHEDVQKRLSDYESFKESISGHEKWTAAQVKLHKLIALRGSWPMLERDWAFYFSMRNIYPGVYAPQHNRKGVAIGAKSVEFHGMS